MSDPKDPKAKVEKPAAGDDDWFSAVDEWEKNFDFTPQASEPTAPGAPPAPAPAAAAPAAPLPLEPALPPPPIETTNPGVDLEMEAASLPMMMPPGEGEEPAALDAAPLAPGGLHEEDPFFKLFEPGDMEVSEEVESLGEPIGADVSGPAPDLTAALLAATESSIGEDAVVGESEATPIPGGGVVDRMASPPVAPTPARAAAPAPAPTPSPAASAPAASSLADAVQRAVEFTADEAGDDELEISISPAAPEPEPIAAPASTSDFADSLEESTRVVSGAEVQTLLAHREENAPEAPVGAAADEDFYDDISIETALPKEAEPAPVAAPPPSSTSSSPSRRKLSVDAPTMAFSLADEARLKARLSDPDSTPLPVGDEPAEGPSAEGAAAEPLGGASSDRGSGRYHAKPEKPGDASSVLQSLSALETDVLDEGTAVLSLPAIGADSFFDEAAAASRARPESKKISEGRLPLPDPRSILDEVKDLGARPSVDAAELVQRTSQLDTERLLASESSVIAQLALAAGRLAEGANDYSLAADHYETAVASEPRWVIGHDALRRARLRLGQNEAAIATLEKSAVGATAAEKAMFTEYRAELLAAIGEEGAALAAVEQAKQTEGQTATWSLGTLALELAARRQEKGPLGSALRGLAQEAEASGERRLAAALHTLVGRLAEDNGDGPAAEQAYRRALELDPTLERGAFGLLRAALRSPSIDDDVEAWQRVLERVQAGPARTALQRRLAQDREARGRAEDVGLVRALYERAADTGVEAGAVSGDRIALWSLAQCDEQRGEHERAIASYSRLADSEPDPARAADLWVTVGSLEQKRGGTAAAVAAYRRATELQPNEVRAARGLERALSQGGDKQAALDRELSLAQRDPGLKRAAWVRAARLEHELGKTADALIHLGGILDEDAGYLPALERFVEISAVDGAPPEVWRGIAARLAAAARDASDPSIGASLFLRAVSAACRSADAPFVDELLTQTGERDLGIDPLELARLVTVYAPTLHGDALQRLAQDLELRDEKRAADLSYARVIHTQLFGGDTEAAISELDKISALDPGHRPASLLHRLLLLRLGRRAQVPAALQPVADAALGDSERQALALRQSVLLDEDGDDARAALGVLTKDPVLLTQPGAAEWASELGRRIGSRLERARLLEAWRAASRSGARRLALGLSLAALYEDIGQSERALETYRQLEADGGDVVQAGLERLLRKTGGSAALGERALARLKAAETDADRVVAYHRLAFLDERLRGDQESAELAYASMTELDPTHPIAYRVSVRRALRDNDNGALATLYRRAAERTPDVVAAAAWAADAGRLHHLLATDSPEAISDWELAVQKDPSSRPALRQLIRIARRRGSAASGLGELYTRLAAASATDPRSVAVCLTRAAEAELEARRVEESLRLFAAAHKERPEHLPAVLQLWALSLVNERIPDAMDAAERTAQVAASPALRGELALYAGTLAKATETPDALDRAIRNLKLAFDLMPSSLEAFERLQQALEQKGDSAALAEVLRRRLPLETDPQRALQLQLQSGRLYRDALSARDLAKEAFTAALTLDPSNAAALQSAADLAWDDQRWAEAAELYIREARVATTPTRQHTIFVRLGEIYRVHLPEPKRAIASYLRACKLDANDLQSLGHLSDLFLGEWEWKGALQATARLAELEPDQVKKIDHLFRVAKIYEEGFQDARKALETLRRAHELDVTYLPAIGELSKYFDRTSDVQSMRVHLDRAAQRFRQTAAQKPYDATAYHALFKIFQWRRAPDRAYLTAGILDYLSALQKEEAQLLERGGGGAYPGPAFAEAQIDEVLFDARLPAGLRMLMRRLDEFFAKAYRADVRRLNLQKSDKLPPRGHPVRDLANRIAQDLGLRELDIHVTAGQPRALLVELGDPVHVVLGSLVCDTQSEAELRFVLGRALKLAHSRVLPFVRMTAEEAAIFVGGLVRQWVPDFVPRGTDEKAVAAEAQKLAKIVPKKVHQELAAFAFECASDQFDYLQIPSAVIDAGNRAGLLAAGHGGAALRALARLDDAAQLRGLLSFLVSDEAAELRRLAGVQVG